MSSEEISSTDLSFSPLGKTTAYSAEYNPALLFPISRSISRKELNLSETLPFFGADVWTAYELSWLNSKGKPMVALAEFIFDVNSPNIVESKSLKLYLNSLNNTKIPNQIELKNLLEKDLSQVSGAPVKVYIYPMQTQQTLISDLEEGVCLDDQDLEITQYSVNPDFLTVQETEASETLYSHLLKSNCLVTGQPDWATLVIKYRGNKIDRAGLLKYIISYRNYNEFHEPCVERIYSDLMQKCAPDYLTVYARYVRRGGLDINPFRSNFEKVNMSRFLRQ